MTRDGDLYKELTISIDEFFKNATEDDIKHLFDGINVDELKDVRSSVINECLLFNRIKELENELVTERAISSGLQRIVNAMESKPLT